MLPFATSSFIKSYAKKQPAQPPAVFSGLNALQR
jgi:hypothetical protein